MPREPSLLGAALKSIAGRSFNKGLDLDILVLSSLSAVVLHEGRRAGLQDDEARLVLTRWLGTLNL